MSLWGVVCNKVKKWSTVNLRHRTFGSVTSKLVCSWYPTFEKMFIFFSNFNVDDFFVMKILKTNKIKWMIQIDEPCLSFFLVLFCVFLSLSLCNALIFSQLQVPLDSMCLYFSSLTTREQHSCTPAVHWSPSWSSAVMMFTSGELSPLCLHP